jgi:hypothetical protein
MEKINLNNTYCYHDFISDEEQIILKEWALANEHRFAPNGAGPFRRFSRLDRLGALPDLFNILKQRVIDTEDIKEFIEAPQNADWMGVQWETAFVEPHMDYNGENPNYYTRRYNILVSFPEAGGYPIYDNIVLSEIKEKTMWRCDAGLVLHSSVPNKGQKPRINLSYGFLMPKK